MHCISEGYHSLGPLALWHMLSIPLSPTQVLRGQECFDGWLRQVGVHAEDIFTQQCHVALVKLEQLCAGVQNLSRS